MNKYLVFFIVLICAFTYGCSSGGSSKPLNVATGPVISSISPTSGGYGTMITINGSNFGVVQSTSIVSYAGVTIIPSSWSNTQIALVLPENAPNNGNFVVVVGGVYSNSSVPFSLSGPVISGISPSTGSTGTEVTISGQYFGTQNSSTYVTFNSTPANIKTWTNTSITCTVPDFYASSGSVSVIVWLDAYRYSNTYSFNLVTPTINNVNPNSDNIGASITLTGQGFGQTQGTITIDNSYAQIISWSEKSIQFRVPQVNTAGWKTLKLTAGGRTVNGSFNVAAPAAQNYTPSPIGKDQPLTIYGDYFGAADDQVTQSLFIKDYGNVSKITWSDTSLSFNWPVTNTWFGSKTVELTISVGGLTQTFTVTAN